MKIIFTDHVIKRLKERNITRKTVNDIILNSKTIHYDCYNYSCVAVGFDKNNLRTISVAFHYENNDVKIHTVHPEKQTEINNRIKTKRYIKYAKR